jgi:uncharacterized peroxidase-related enzyme
MAFIHTLTDEEVSDEARPFFESDRERLGFVANYTRLFAQRPEVEAARRQLLGAIARNLGPRRYELVTVAAAGKLRSSYCTLAHGKILAEEHLSATAVRDLVVDPHTSGLDEVELAVVDFARKIIDDATSVIPADIERLRELGLSDVEILDVALAAAVRCFVSKTLDAFCVEADSIYAELEGELRKTLTVGRSIVKA